MKMKRIGHLLTKITKLRLAMGDLESPALEIPYPPGANHSAQQWWRKRRMNLEKLEKEAAALIAAGTVRKFGGGNPNWGRDRMKSFPRVLEIKRVENAKIRADLAAAGDFKKLALLDRNRDYKRRRRAAGISCHGNGRKA